MAYANVVFDKFFPNWANDVFNFKSTGDTLKIYLSNDTPDSVNDNVKADITEISTGYGYTGPIDVENDIGTPTTSAKVPVVGANKTITASGGSIGPFRYVVLYDDTPSSPTDPLICYWDIGTSITLTDGQALDINFYVDGTYTTPVLFFIKKATS